MPAGICCAATAPPETWWGVLLGGLIGSVLGGLITGIAVAMTLKHERKMAFVAMLHSTIDDAAGAVVTLVRLSDPTQRELEQHIGTVGSLISHVASRATAIGETQLATVLRDLTNGLNNLAEVVNDADETHPSPPALSSDEIDLLRAIRFALAEYVSHSGATFRSGAATAETFIDRAARDA